PATTASDHQSPSISGCACFTFHAITASRTMPTLCVLVIITGPSRKPESSTHVVPVISPLPFSVNHAAKTAPLDPFPRGSTAVTPVRAGPSPTFRGPSPEIRVVCPTSTPFTSVIALKGPGMPSNGTPKSRARGLVCAETRTAKNRTETHALRCNSSIKVLRSEFRSIKHGSSALDYNSAVWRKEWKTGSGRFWQAPPEQASFCYLKARGQLAFFSAESVWPRWRQNIPINLPNFVRTSPITWNEERISWMLFLAPESGWPKPPKTAVQPGMKRCCVASI